MSAPTSLLLLLHKDLPESSHQWEDLHDFQAANGRGESRGTSSTIADLRTVACETARFVLEANNNDDILVHRDMMVSITTTPRPLHLILHGFVSRTKTKPTRITHRVRKTIPPSSSHHLGTRMVSCPVGKQVPSFPFLVATFKWSNPPIGRGVHPESRIESMMR
ncbi:hypothetical protein J3R30DRAFT_1380183 [Lentinula aciculospora]|uniref:Uncharacterized protein n=1 Tax=Lentinula aciculospora TaxID=153920 RepID=A0A9W9DTD9_9AGAR|nr:hypothetical protein J3R30DRAFT_1380183 [Lentinula aciculospora]